MDYLWGFFCRDWPCSFYKQLSFFIHGQHICPVWCKAVTNIFLKSEFHQQVVVGGVILFHELKHIFLPAFIHP